MRAMLSWTRINADHGWHSEMTTAADGAAVAVLHGPEQPSPAPFSIAIPSWSVRTPAGSWIEVQLRARIAGRWTGFYRMAQWDDRPEASFRQSFPKQCDRDGQVDTDSLALFTPADALQPRLLLHAAGGAWPAPRALWAALSTPGQPGQRPFGFTPRELPVPPRSQMTYPHGARICSPTSIAMLLAYWHARTGAEHLAPFADRAAVSKLVAPRVYDPVYDGYGNWSFNTAYAAAQGLDAYVACFDGLERLEPWIAAGIPVVVSLAWKAGELANAPIASSGGHLLIVAGFESDGRVIVADPRAEREEEVRRIYDAAQLETAWQRNSDGMTYIIHPPGWPAPELPV
jgi:hypothetical protein